jgi:hypothetical protein
MGEAMSTDWATQQREAEAVNDSIRAKLFAAGFVTGVQQIRYDHEEAGQDIEFHISTVMGGAVVRLIYPVSLGAEEVTQRAIVMLDRMEGRTQ